MKADYVEAMKLALEALKQIDEAMPFPVAKLAQAALREALAEQPAKLEPVAWMDGYRNIYSLEEKAAGCEDAVIPLVPATLQHWSDCAVHNEPAYPAGKCDCGGYTSPQPSKPLSVLMITTAYEQGVGKGQQVYWRKEEIENPYSPGECHEAWQLGYKEGKTQAKDIEAAHGIKENT